MKNKIKSISALFMAFAFILTATPLSGFAAEIYDVTVKNGTLLNSEGNSFEGTLKEGDKITGEDDGLFYVKINGVKDENSSHYGADSFKGYKENSKDSEESGNTYYKSYTLSAAPEGYNPEAKITVSKSEDFAGNENLRNANIVNIEYTPIEAVKEFKITYYSNGKQYGEVQTYKAGDKITPPDAPEASEGQICNGWVINEKQDTLPETMPENDIEASASWKLKDVNIIFRNDDAEHHKATATFASSMESVIPADPKKDGYVFAGWYDENGKNAFDYSTVPSNDITFNAKWLKNGNVVYMSGNKTYEAFEVKEGDKIPVPEKNPEKFAHKFKGWTPEIPDVMPAEDLTFKAEFEVDKDFVTIVIGGTVIAGGIIGLTSAAITGLSIVGGIIAIIGLSSIIGNVNKTYKVTYMVDGKVYKTYNVASGAKISVPEEPAKEGYSFAGWTPEIPEKMPKNDLTFEAKWSEKNTDIPDTGSSIAGLAGFAVLAISTIAATIILKKKKSEI